jgi:hypothetical protein
MMKRRLYSRSGVCHLWLVDPDARAVEVIARDSDRYALVAGADAVDLPPFTGLGLIPDALWP